MIEKLVRVPRARVRCEVYTCRNIAEFEVGHPVQIASNMHYCRDCMMQIVREAGEMAGILEKTEISENKIEENNDNVTTKYDMDKGNSVPEEESDMELEVSEPETVGEFYMCRHCGKKFPKPAGLKEYKIHCLQCAKLK